MSEGVNPPDVIVIGAMKCATSTVCAYLEDHPAVYMAPGCEPNFFSHDENWAKGPSWYEAFLAPAASGQMRGEGSNAYASIELHPKTVERMATFAPEAKLIFMVRDPVARIASAWLQNRVDRGAATPASLDEAVLRMPALYVGDSRYWRTLSAYRARFPAAQIFVGFMEDMQADQEAFFSKLCAFLGAPPTVLIRRAHVNPSAGKRAPSRLYDRVKALPGVDAAKVVVPAALRRWVKDRVLSTRYNVKPAFSPRVLTDLREALRADSAALLADADKPADFWPMRT